MSDLAEVRAFLAGDGTDHRGRTLAQVIAADDAWLEATHDFIQWLFPATQASQFNPFAPVLSKAEFAALSRDARAVAGVRQGWLRMLAFYGLEDAGGVVRQSSAWAQRAPNWAAQPGHNDLRITRALNCLVLLGLADSAREWLDFLQAHFAADPTRQRALRHWQQAVHG